VPVPRTIRASCACTSFEALHLSKKRDDRSPKEIAQDKKERAAADGRAAMVEIAERAAFVAKNTAKLRELRLAKEAAEREREAAEPPKPAKKKASRTKKA
jgi:hypothetical protein